MQSRRAAPRWRTVAWSAALALALVGCTRAQERSPRQSDEQLAALCADIQNSYECAQAVERHQLQKPVLARQVARKGKALHLQLRDGKNLTVADTQPADEASIVKYSFRDYLSEIGYFLLHRQYYEGEEYVMLQDQTGKMFPLPNVPVVSPDKSRLATTFAGLSGGYSPNTVEIWLLTPAGLAQEFTTHPRDWEPTGAVWVDNATIRLTTRTPPGADGNIRTQTVELKLRENKWMLGEPRP